MHTHSIEPWTHQHFFLGGAPCSEPHQRSPCVAGRSGPSRAIVSLVSDQPQDPAAYKSRLRDLSHITVEVQRCTGHLADAA
jgi:hypothetical protein